MTLGETDRRVNEARKHVRFCVRVCKHQIENVRYHLHEHPMNAKSWDEPETKALTKKAYIDDLEIDEEGVADILMDDNAINKAPRPGTSFLRPLSSSGRDGGIS